MNLPETALRDKRILTLSLSGAQRYTLRKENKEEAWMRAIRENEAYLSVSCKPWTPFDRACQGEVRQFAGLRYQCVQAHLLMPGYEPDRTPALWKAID